MQIYTEEQEKRCETPKKLDIHMTSEKKDKLEQFLGKKLPECSEEWDDFKALLQEAAEHTFGKEKESFKRLV